MNNYVGLTKKIKVPRFIRRTDLGRWGSLWTPEGRVALIKTRDGFDEIREEMIRRHGMNMPQKINDALTRKDLELKQRGE